MDIRKIVRIHKLIKAQATGSPKALALQLGVSERTVLYYIRFMREELSTPIKWNAYKKSYVYEEIGELVLEWQCHE